MAEPAEHCLYEGGIDSRDRAQVVEEAHSLGAAK
jgi:hypothetical protein